MSSFDQLGALGCEYLPGTLVEVKTSGGFESGIVVDWWPSNVYESAYYDILIDGKTLPFERKHVFSHRPNLSHANP